MKESFENLDMDKGQHTLINKEIIEKEVELAQISKKDFVVEIGAGTGNLTEKLVSKAGKVLAFEIDEKYKKYLITLQEKNKNLEIVFGNAFSYTWKNCTKIVSNIPYFVSDQFIHKAIKEKIAEIIVIVGEKFKKKLENKETKIGFITNLFYNINPLMKVDRKNFYPVPRTDSWLLKLKRKERQQGTESIICSIVLKNGKIKNAILYSLIELGKTKRMARKIIQQMKIHNHVLEKPVSKITGKFLIKIEKDLEKIKI